MFVYVNRNENLQDKSCAKWWGEPTPQRKLQIVERVQWIWWNSLKSGNTKLMIYNQQNSKPIVGTYSYHRRTFFTAYFSLKHNCVDYKRSRWYFEQHLDLKWWHTHTSYSIYSELLISASTFTETKNLQRENCAIWWGEPTPLRKFQTIELVWWIWQNSLVVKI
jgi:hypothetical protein